MGNGEKLTKRLFVKVWAGPVKASPHQQGEELLMQLKGAWVSVLLEPKEGARRGASYKSLPIGGTQSI